MSIAVILEYIRVQNEIESATSIFCVCVCTRLEESYLLFLCRPENLFSPDIFISLCSNVDSNIAFEAVRKILNTKSKLE